MDIHVAITMLDFDVSMTILRVVVGGLFLIHGTQKLFGWFDGPGMDGTEQMMQGLGMQPARLHAAAAATFETLGGLLLLTGLFVPVAALMLVAVMTTAIRTVHLAKGLFNHNGGYEFNLVMLAVPVAVASVGPGWLSLDNLFGVTWASWGWAVAALVAGVIGSTVAIATARSGGAAAEQA